MVSVICGMSLTQYDIKLLDDNPTESEINILQNFARYCTCIISSPLQGIHTCIMIVNKRSVLRRQCSDTIEI